MSEDLTTYEPDDFEELNRNEALDYINELDEEGGCPSCGGPVIEDDGLKCQLCDWKEENEDID